MACRYQHKGLRARCPAGGDARSPIRKADRLSVTAGIAHPPARFAFEALERGRSAGRAGTTPGRAGAADRRAAWMPSCGAVPAVGARRLYLGAGVVPGVSGRLAV